MLLKTLQVTNFRSIADSGELDLGPITVFIGKNNAGKSALLHAVLMAHEGTGWEKANIRHGATRSGAVMRFAGTVPTGILRAAGTNLDGMKDLHLEVRAGEHTATRLTWPVSVNRRAETQIQVPSSRPYHFLVPVLTRRRSQVIQTTVDSGAAAQVGLSDGSLASRLAALGGDHAEGNAYRALMERILGLNVSTFLVSAGMMPGVPLSSSDGIALERMGDGVRNVVLLTSELVDEAQPRLFLIEEPENDLHPQALLSLLQTLRDYSDRHQFIVSTHSDVVLRELGSLADSRVYDTINENVNGLPTTSYRPLSDEFDRREALENLGYTSELPVAWLVFEESTAE